MGYKAGILDDNILNGTVIIILISCIVASFATEKAAKQIVIESDDDTVGFIKPSGADGENILLPIANISNIEKLLEFAIFIKDKKSQTYFNPVCGFNNEDAEINILKARNKLEEFVKQASASEAKCKYYQYNRIHNVGSGISRISKKLWQI